MEEKKKKREVTHSYMTGVIALVFMVIGYQTALFVHNAAVMKIVANRDHPDTVYIYNAPSQTSSISRHDPSAQSAVSAQSASLEIEVTGPRRPAHGDNKTQIASKRSALDGRRAVTDANRTEHHPSKHSKRAEAVRENYPRKVETFRFDPNTISMEDLCRLGFSPKQAQSIDNYRQKGGRFRRKSDFAKSYVVSDSIYARLEPYIDIPLLDLNLADSTALDALPGIGGWFVTRIIAHRSALGGFSYKEQLMDIRNLDREKYELLVDLVTVSERYVRPYPLWSLPADSLRLHPYIGDYSAKGIVLYRENNPKERWTVEELVKAGILSSENAPKLARCLIQQP